MNEAIDPVEERIVAAVQLELNRFGAEIVDRFVELQRHAAAESSARYALETRFEQLSRQPPASDHELRAVVADMQVALARLEKNSQSAEQHIASMVERADIAVNGVMERVARFDENRLEIEARLDRLDRRRNEALERLAAVEERLGGIDEIVGGATAGIADRVEHLANAHDAMAKQTTEELDAIRAEIAESDADAIDALQDRVSSALGQAELVRIEMDRFQETMKNELESNVSRLTAIETAVQDQRMDVESAVQLERLEEVERMVLMLDPQLAESDATAPAATDESVDTHSSDDRSAFADAADTDTDRADDRSLPRLAPSVGN